MSNESQILTVPISKVKPWDKNPRSIHKKDFDRLKKHITKYGQYKPLICYKQNGKYVALGGNMRLKAMQDLKISDAQILVVQAKTEKAKIELSLIDNDRAGYYDDQALAELIYPFKDELDLANFKVDLRISDMDLGKVIDRFAPENEQDDVVPPLPKKTNIKLGHLFQLGKHRLLCGDATKQKDVERLMDGKKAVLMNTDPPYGIDFVKLNKSKGQSTHYKNIENDDLVDGASLQNFLEQTIRIAVPFLTDNCPFYLWHPMLTQGTFFAAAAAAAAADILINRQIIWVKPSIVFGRGDYHWKHELCFYGWRRGNKPIFYGERNQSTVWNIGRENSKIHPTQKPVRLFEIPVLNHTQRNEICYEPFCGSGSQLIACEKLNRICYGTEIDPHYCQVIIDRWEKYTGQKAVKV